ncbi:hydroxyacylglutathione hydrolase [Maritalea myrionectae]|uniref:Hydroxyacylglutathione hydrolase n=1 Tax=Maritalea myrionectae TaxID=454601 RepID=A0A2R4MGQ1_9HYPH|nr:MBL fold metallo-hydrolase [Maritalea myrionectae]AVX05180.1 hydroxyacylglutathione hydrolase [Maritalea myrionectae]
MTLQQQTAPSYQTDFSPKIGEAESVAPFVERIVAPNASPYTFTGTNCFLVGQDELAIIDPGPDVQAHINAIDRALNGRKVVAILLTHTHRDHSAVAPKLAHKYDVPLMFGGPHRPARALRLFEIDPMRRSGHYGLRPDRTLKQGDIIRLGAVEIEVIETPGHCANHICFALSDRAHILTGDHIMGWNSTLIADPDGALAPYLESIDFLLACPGQIYLPAHGDRIVKGKKFAKALKGHRLQRNAQIIDLLKENAKLSAWQLTDKMYPDVSMAVKGAALLTVKAHLHFLTEQDKLRKHTRLLRQPVYSAA